MYPEHEKLKALRGDNQVIGDFLEHLLDSGFSICMWDGEEEGNFPDYRPISSWIAWHFGIDEGKLEEEKRAMLDELRRQNG